MPAPRLILVIGWAYTSDSFVRHFDGSDVGLNNSSAEDTDAAALTAGGNLIFSTIGSFAVTGVSGDDEDLAEFSGTFGSSTSGTFSLRQDPQHHRHWIRPIHEIRHLQIPWIRPIHETRHLQIPWIRPIHEIRHLQIPWIKSIHETRHLQIPWIRPIHEIHHLQIPWIKSI